MLACQILQKSQKWQILAFMSTTVLKTYKIKTLTAFFCKKWYWNQSINEIYLYLHIYIICLKWYWYKCHVHKITSIALENRSYVFIYCSVITKVTKHLKIMLQQALGPKVYRLLQCILIGVNWKQQFLIALFIKHLKSLMENKVTRYLRQFLIEHKCIWLFNLIEYDWSNVFTVLFYEVWIILPH